MKLKFTKILAILTILVSFSATTKAQQVDEVLNLLIKKGVILQDDADSLRAELALKEQTQKEKQTKYNLTVGKPLQLSGYIQGRYQILDEKGKIDGSDIRRARLDLKGVITEKWDYRLQIDFATSPKLIDAVIAYKYNDLLKVTAGQFKVPFSLENLTSSNKLETIERSQVVQALVGRGKDVIGNQNGRDIGGQLSGSFLKIGDLPLFDYAIGVFNGSGINGLDNNENKDVVGRLTVHPIKGLDIAGEIYDGRGNWGTVLTNNTRKRTGFDAKYTYKSLSLSGEFIQGRDAQIKREGWYAQAGVFILSKKVQLLAKYDTYDPDKAVGKDISEFYVGGVNYFFNTWAKIQLNYTYKEEQDTKLNNNLFSGQLQLQF